MTSDVTVVVPTYDEAANIAAVARAIRATGACVLIVDDASPDGTGAIADTLAAEDPWISVIHRPEKRGLGPAYAAGFAAALERDAAIVCQMDADLSHDPADLPRLIAVIRRGADVGIGSRYVPGGSTVGWSAYRRFLSRGGNRYAAAMLGLGIADSTAGFRAWSRDAIAVVEPETCASVGYAFQVEMAWRAIRRGLTVVEVPVVFRDRERGISKMSAGIALEAMMRVTRWGVTSRLTRRS